MDELDKKFFMLWLNEKYPWVEYSVSLSNMLISSFIVISVFLFWFAVFQWVSWGAFGYACLITLGYKYSAELFLALLIKYYAKDY